MPRGTQVRVISTKEDRHGDKDAYAVPQNHTSNIEFAATSVFELTTRKDSPTGDDHTIGDPVGYGDVLRLRQWKSSE